MSQPQNIRVIKLSSGDTLVADFKMVKDHNPPYVVLTNPVAFEIVPNRDGVGTMFAQKWLQTDDKVFTIPFMHIVTTAQPNEMILDYYAESLTEIEEADAYEEDELESMSFDGTYH